MALIHYSQCPICGSTDLKQGLLAKDYTVSGEKFAILECGACTLRFTQDVPDAVQIIPYYHSEDYISHSNTSKGLINSIYQRVRHRTIRNKVRAVKRRSGLSTGALLDLGSGTGTFAHAMIKAGWSVTALEPDPEARKLATSLYGIQLSGMEAFQTMAPGSMDVITLWHVLEHVHDFGAYWRQFEKVLKPSGKLMIAVPNYTSLDASIYREFWAAYDVPRHLYHFSPAAMETMIRQSGFTLHAIQPMWYDSFYISLLSSRYKHGRSRWISAGWNALRSNLAAAGNHKRCSSLIYVIGRPGN